MKKEEYLKTYTWMNTLRGGVLRDVYALIYQLEHDTRSNGTVKISIAYISERLGYSNQRNVQRAIAELKEMGLLEVEYGNGKRSIFKTQTPAKIAPPTEGENPCQISTPDNLAPLLNRHPSPAKIAPLTPYISKDNRLDNTPPPPACARERLEQWISESNLTEWATQQFYRKGYKTEIDIGALLDDFYDNDFSVRERCEQNERMEVLKHFQNWLPKYLNKRKNDNNNEQQHRNTRATADSTPADTTQRKPYSRISQLADTEFDIE